MSRTSSNQAKSTSFTVTIPARMAGGAAKAAREMGITKAQLVKRALAEMLEEIEDLKTVEARRSEKSIPWARAKKEIGLHQTGGRERASRTGSSDLQADCGLH